MLRINRKRLICQSNWKTMKCLQRYFLLLFSLTLIAGCKSKKASLSGEDPVAVSDFIDFFPEKKLPFQVSDSTMLRKEKDSLLISYKVFTQFVPDSILTRIFGKGGRPKMYPLGKVKGGDDTYLFLKAVAGENRTAFVLGFDKADQFIAAMPFLHLDQASATQQSSVLDTRYSITKNVLKRNADGSISDGKDVYVLNSAAKSFMLIMTDALDDKVTELINPIDTLPRKQKYSADYGSGKMNLVSIRDGRKADRVRFFIHFEKNNGECSGELKGEALLKSPTQAIYREAGDPCSLQFNFAASSVSVKELEGCGSRRGLRCSFDGVYSRKKEIKPKAVKPKTPTRK